MTDAPRDEYLFEPPQQEDRQALPVVAGIGEWLHDRLIPEEHQDKPGNNWSFDWCAFRRDQRCYYPRDLDDKATEEAGYPIWIPIDRGHCPRHKWEEQKACPLSIPGPDSGELEQYPDQTRTWDEGGQRYSALQQEALQHAVAHQQRTADLDELAEAGYVIDEWTRWQQGGCSTYALALLSENPSLSLGALNDGAHFFAYDDQYAYDSAGRHPMPYRGVGGDADIELDVEVGDYFFLREDGGSQDDGEPFADAVAHIRRHRILEGGPKTASVIVGEGDLGIDYCIACGVATDEESGSDYCGDCPASPRTASLALLSDEEWEVISDLIEEFDVASTPDKNCWGFTLALAQRLGWEQVSGWFVGQGQREGHYWNLTPSGVLVDPTYEQFSGEDGTDVRILGPGDPARAEYEATSPRTAATESPLEWPHQGVTLYHGTSPSAAEAIREQGFRLPDAPTGRGRDYGYAVYFTPDRSWAMSYARGAVVKATLKPHARILDLAYAQSAGLIDKHYDTYGYDFWPAFAKEHGWHGVTTNGEVVAIYDTSVLDIGGQREAALTDSPQAWDAAATGGMRWVYHATTADAYERFVASGVRMSEVPMNLNRQRYQRYLDGDTEALGDIFYTPGAGVGMGMYVGGSPQAVSGFGRYIIALLVPESALERPPEANGATDPVDWFLGNSLGMLLTEDVPPDRVVGLGRITSIAPGTHPVDFYRESQRTAASGFDVTVFRGIKVPDPLPAGVEDLLSPPMEESEIDQHLGAGSILLEAYGGGDGLGRSWSRRRSVAEKIHGPGHLVVFEARAREADEDPTAERAGGYANALEDEWTAGSGAEVEVIGVYLPEHYYGGSWGNLLAEPVRMTAWRGGNLLRSEGAKTGPDNRWTYGDSHRFFPGNFPEGQEFTVDPKDVHESFWVLRDERDPEYGGFASAVYDNLMDQWAPGHGMDLQWAHLTFNERMERRRQGLPTSSLSGDEYIEAIAQSMKTVGQKEPIVFTYNETYGKWWLSEGNHRLAAALRHGLSLRAVRRGGPSREASRTAAKGDYLIVELDTSGVSTTRAVALVLDEGDEERNWMLPKGQMYRLAGFLTFDDQTMTTELAWTAEEARRKGVQKRLWEAAERLAGGPLKPHGMHSPAGEGLARSIYDGDIEDLTPITEAQAESMAARFKQSMGMAIGFFTDDLVKDVVIQKVFSRTAQRTAAWEDVVKKAARIRREGGVRILSAPEKGSSNQDWIVADVRGDTNVYRTELMKVAGNRSTAMWRCGCAWAAYSWGRSGRWTKYEGRMCSHALAVQYEAQARAGFDYSEPIFDDPKPKEWGVGVEPQYEHDRGPLPDPGFV